MRRSPAYIETPQIRLPPAVNISHQNIRRVHSEPTQNFIYPSLKCKWQIHTKLLAPNDLISLSYRTQYCVWNDNVYYELKKNRLKYLSATWPVLEDFLGLLKVSLSRHNESLRQNGVLLPGKIRHEIRKMFIMAVGKVTGKCWFFLGF